MATFNPLGNEDFKMCHLLQCGCAGGVMFNGFEREIEQSSISGQTGYIHFRIKTFEKGMNSHLPSYEFNSKEV